MSIFKLIHSERLVLIVRFWTCAFLILVNSSLVNAQDAGAIAVVDLPAAVLQTEAAKKRFSEFEKQKKLKEDISQFEADKKSYVKARKDLEKNRAVMSPSKLNEAMLEASNMEEDLEHAQKKIQKALQVVRQQLLQEYWNDALGIVDNIVKEQSIGLLLSSEPGVVMHATKAYDITDQVTERLNKLKK